MKWQEVGLREEQRGQYPGIQATSQREHWQHFISSKHVITNRLDIILSCFMSLADNFMSPYFPRGG